MANGGALSSQMMVSAGLDRSTLSRRVRSGWLTSPFKGVYIVESLADDLSILRAAGLAHPSGAVCRFSAASIHGFRTTAPKQPQFLVAHGSGLRCDSRLSIYETRSLPEADVVNVEGLRLTSPARTICDISGLVLVSRLRHIVEMQLTHSRPSADDLVECVESRRRRGVRGVSRLALMLSMMLDDQPFPESILELRLAEGLAEIGLDGLLRQFRPDWYDGIRGIVDAADPVGRTIIEADGRRFRQVTAAHDNDRARDRKAAANGYLVIRVGYREFNNRRGAVLAEISDVVRARRTEAEEQIRDRAN